MELSESRLQFEVARKVRLYECDCRHVAGDPSWLSLWKEVRRIMKRTFIIVAVLGLIVGSLLMSGCNTWEGVGEDVENVGENIQGE